MTLTQAHSRFLNGRKKLAVVIGNFSASVHTQLMQEGIIEEV